MTDRLTDAELDAIRERLAAATPGPWRAEYSGATGPVVMDAESVDARDHVARCPHYRGHADAGFIAHTPTDVAALLAEVERLRAERSGMTARYAPAYRSPITGVVCRLSTETVVRGDADAEASALRAEAGDEHDVFVARRLMTPWVPVKDGDQR